MTLTGLWSWLASKEHGEHSVERSLKDPICFSNILAMVDEVRAAYDVADRTDRKVLLKILKQNAHKVWDSGDWPSALAIGIVCLNLESLDTSGAAALQVRRETDALIARPVLLSDDQLKVVQICEQPNFEGVHPRRPLF